MFSPKSIWGGAGAPPKKGQSTKGNGLGKSSNYRWTCPAIPETSCHAPKGISKKISDIIPWRIHGAGIYTLTLIGGFCWWDPWHTIYSSTVRIRHGYSWLLQRIWIVSSFVGIWTLKKWGNADDFQIGRFIQARFFKKKGGRRKQNLEIWRGHMCIRPETMGNSFSCVQGASQRFWVMFHFM